MRGFIWDCLLAEAILDCVKREVNLWREVNLYTPEKLGEIFRGGESSHAIIMPIEKSG